MSNFSTIDLPDLARVIGGEGDIYGPGAGPNRDDYHGKLDIKGPVVSGSGEGSARWTRSDIGKCLDKGFSPEQCKVLK